MRKKRIESASEMEPGRPELEKKPIAVAIIDMARHSFKASTERQELSQKGMEEAVKAGREREYYSDDLRRELQRVYGTPRERTTQSSVLRKFADEFKGVDFTGVDPEDIVRWLEQGGLAKTETPFLTFEVGDGEYKEAMFTALKDGQYLTWVVGGSDQMAIDLQQDPEKVTPLSVQAENVGEFFFAKAWELYESAQKGEPATQKLDFATSHAGVLESFLYKALRRVRGEDAAKEFVESLPNGFKENQGFTARVMVEDPNDPKAWSVDIEFSGDRFAVSSEDIAAIIQDGQQLRKRLVENKKQQ